MLTVWLSVKGTFVKNENFARSIVIFYNKFRSTLKKGDIQRVFWILSDKTKVKKKSTIRKALRPLILHVNNSKKIFKKLVKKLLT